jgi:phage-related tail fiber protein
MQMADKKPIIITTAGSLAQLKAGEAVGVSQGGTAATTAAGARENLGLEIGVDVQGFDQTLAALAGLDSTIGLVTEIGNDVFAKRQIVSNTLSVTNPAGVAGDIGVNLVDVMTAGTYTKFTTDSKGRVISGMSLLPSDIPGLDWSKITSGKPTTLAGYGITDAMAGNQTITFSGDASGSGTTSVALSLSASGVTAGTYPKVTVDSKGRVTNGANLSASDIPSLGAEKITSGTLSVDTSGNAATATKLETARTINGVSFDGSANITINAVDSTSRIASSEKGAANGVATLDATGLVPSSQLPSYVDDVLEYANLAALPGTGVSAKIYVTLDNNKIYRWSGSAYIEISPVAGNSDTATKLSTARTIGITGDVTWTSPAFDGSSNVTAAATLANSGVTAGTYKSVTVDAKGRVTGGTNPTTLAGFGIADAQPLDADLTAIAGLVGTSGFLKKTAADTWSLDTSSYLTGNQAITFSGDATGTGTTAVALTLANSGVTAGTYPKVTVDAKGRVTTGAALAASDIPALDWSKITTGKPTTLAGYGITDAMAGNQTITFSGDASGSGTTSVALSLSASGVTAGTYPKVTVDSKGRVTNGANLSASDIPSLGAEKITSGTLSVDTSGNAATATKLETARTINGVSFDGSANITINAVDSTSRIASSEKGAANGVATLDATGLVPSSQLPSYVDDVLEYANLAALPGTGVSAKIYVTLDNNKIYRWSGSAYIEISPVAGNSDTATKLSTARTIGITGDVTWTSPAFDGSSNVTAAATLANSGVTAGTYKSVTVDAKGRVTGGTNPTTLAGFGIADAQPLDADLTAIAGLVGTSGFLKKTAADTWSLDTSSYLTGNQAITFSGDATGTGTTAVALTLANSGVTAGTYPKVTVDAKGRVTTGAALAASDIPALDWSKITTGKPTTLAGYGITDFGIVPANAQTVAYTAALTDSGKSVDTSAGVTIPANSAVAFPVGTVFNITNTSAAAITITQGAGVTLRMAGTTLTGNRTLAAYGVSALRKIATDTWMISGSGLS